MGVDELSAPNNTALWGDFLAIVGGILGSAYLLLGRDIRQNTGIQEYGTIVCLSSAAVLGLLCLGMSIPIVDYDSNIWIIFILMALFPQFLGHIGINFTLRRLKASTISLALLFEPVGAAFLSWFFIGETPSTMEFIGSMIILSGLAIGIEAE